MFFGDGHAHQAQFSKLLPERGIATGICFPGGADTFRRNLVHQEITHRFPEQQLVFAKCKIHDLPRHSQHSLGDDIALYFVGARIDGAGL